MPDPGLKVINTDQPATLMIRVQMVGDFRDLSGVWIEYKAQDNQMSPFCFFKKIPCPVTRMDIDNVDFKIWMNSDFMLCHSRERGLKEPAIVLLKPIRLITGLGADHRHGRDGGG